MKKNYRRSFMDPVAVGGARAPPDPSLNPPLSLSLYSYYWGKKKSPIVPLALQDTSANKKIHIVTGYHVPWRNFVGFWILYEYFLFDPLEQRIGHHGILQIHMEYGLIHMNYRDNLTFWRISFMFIPLFLIPMFFLRCIQTLPWKFSCILNSCGIAINL